MKLKYLKVGLETSSPHKLIFFENTHNHASTIRKKKHLYNMGEIFESMKNMPVSMPVAEFKTYLKNKYQIEDNHVYYILSQFRKDY